MSYFDFGQATAERLYMLYMFIGVSLGEVEGSRPPDFEMGVVADVGYP